MVRLLPNIHSPQDLKGLSLSELNQLAAEIRQEICAVVAKRSAHFASNLGVVELTLALHSVFDFSCDRLIWDVGHQTYPHKLVTGRYEQFSTIRTRGGLMGYPNPAESIYDLFMTGHAGCSISSALGLRCGDDLIRALEEEKKRLERENKQNPNAETNADTELPSRHVVAVIGDGSFSSGVVFEGLNHLGELRKNITVILNDNKMSICPRVGSFGHYLDSLRMNPYYTEMKEDLKQMVQRVPFIGKGIRSRFHDLKMAFKACVSGGMLFEELGIRYIGPVDGHDIRQLQKFLRMARQYRCPVLLHVLTQKGHGYSPAEDDPTRFHAPAPQLVQGVSLGVPKPPEASDLAPEKIPAQNSNPGSTLPETKPDRSYTVIASQKIMELMERNPKVVVITAAMCQGNKLERIRQKFPERFFDVGICESHAVVLASGMAKAGLHPIVDVYSTFMQRAFDHIFQEVSLQNLPVTLLMDRAGLVGADGPTHHGAYDLAYLRPLPNLVMTAPCDAFDLEQMLELAVTQDAPFTIRYSKTQTPEITVADRQPVRMGQCEILQEGSPDGGLILACGVQAAEALAAVRMLGDSSISVVNLRFVKPLDLTAILPRALRAAWVLTAEEGSLIGGVGSEILSSLSDASLNTNFPNRIPPFLRLGIGDSFIQHASRAEQLAEAGLDVSGICRAIEKLTCASGTPD